MKVFHLKKHKLKDIDKSFAWIVIICLHIDVELMVDGNF